MLELAVKLPASMPLRAPDLECRRKVMGGNATSCGCMGGWVGAAPVTAAAVWHVALLRVLRQQPVLAHITQRAGI